MHLQPRKRICKLHLLDSIHRRRTVRALGPPCPLPQSPHTRIHTITKVRNVKHNFLSALLIRRFILNPTVPQAVPYQMMMPPPGGPGGPPHGYDGGPAPPVPMGHA